MTSRFARWADGVDQRAHARSVERKRIAAIGAVQPRPKTPVATQTRLLRIAGGVAAGVAVAHVINSGNDSANSWALAAWANQNGVQL